jgi:hypothetical protein
MKGLNDSLNDPSNSNTNIPSSNYGIQTPLTERQTPLGKIEKRNTFTSSVGGSSSTIKKKFEGLNQQS